MRTKLILAITSLVSLSALRPVPDQRVSPRGLHMGAFAGVLTPPPQSGGFTLNRKCDTNNVCVTSTTRACRTEVISTEGEDLVLICTDKPM